MEKDLHNTMLAFAVAILLAAATLAYAALGAFTLEFVNVLDGAPSREKINLSSGIQPLRRLDCPVRASEKLTVR